LSTGTLEETERLLILSLAEQRQKAEENLKTYELFIYEEVRCITIPFRKNVLKIATP
jgi:hypothetical protein